MLEKIPRCKNNEIMEWGIVLPAMAVVFGICFYAIAKSLIRFKKMPFTFRNLIFGKSSRNSNSQEKNDQSALQQVTTSEENQSCAYGVCSSSQDKTSKSNQFTTNKTTVVQEASYFEDKELYDSDEFQSILRESLGYIYSAGKYDCYTRCLTIMEFTNENVDEHEFTLRFAWGLSDVNDLMNEFFIFYQNTLLGSSDSLRAKTIENVKLWCRRFTLNNCVETQKVFKHCVSPQIIFKHYVDAETEIEDDTKPLEVLVYKSIEMAIIYEHFKCKKEWDIWDVALHKHIVDGLIALKRSF